jgi:hypothetical protein
LRNEPEHKEKRNADASANREHRNMRKRFAIKWRHSEIIKQKREAGVAVSVPNNSNLSLS